VVNVIMRVVGAQANCEGKRGEKDTPERRQRKLSSVGRREKIMNLQHQS